MSERAEGGRGTAASEGEAGRRLDARVAVEVMGWEITHRGHRVMPGDDHPHRPIVARGREDSREMRGFSGKADAMEWIATVCPRYSTDIAAAWLVVERVREMRFSQRIRFGDALTDAVSGRMDPTGSLRITWPSALLYLEPVDICRAALAARAITPDSESPENPANPSSRP